MHSFLRDLIENGRVVVPLAMEEPRNASVDLHPLIRQLDSESRMEFAFTPPALSLDAAVWALQFVENACRFLVYRELDETIMADRLRPNCPVPQSVICTYSVDLLMRYLPDVTRMAKGVGENDPLVKHLLKAAACWPLSSIGIAGITCDSDEVDLILSNPCLRQLYVDRIIERKDASRLAPEAVRDAITAAVGMHASLAPEIFRAIENYQEQT